MDETILHASHCTSCTLLNYVALARSTEQNKSVRHFAVGDITLTSRYLLYIFRQEGASVSAQKPTNKHGRLKLGYVARLEERECHRIELIPPCRIVWYFLAISGKINAMCHFNVGDITLASTHTFHIFKK